MRDCVSYTRRAFATPLISSHGYGLSLVFSSLVFACHHRYLQRVRADLAHPKPSDILLRTLGTRLFLGRAIYHRISGLALPKLLG